MATDLFDGPSWPSKLADLMRRLLETIQSTEAFRAAAVFGSRARTDRPADVWADVDLLVISTDPAHLSSDEWLAEVHPLWVSLIQEAPIPGLLFRQVVFAGGFDFDVVVLEPGRLSKLIAGEGGDEAFGHGISSLVDKDGELATVDFREAPPYVPPPLDAEAFSFAIADLNMQMVYAVKHLLRGELWVARSHLDGWLRDIFLRLIRWDAHLREPDVKTFPHGRRLERWASPDACSALVATSGGYEPHALATALDNVIPSFGPVIERIARSRGFDVDRAGLGAVGQWTTEQLAPLRQP